MLRLGSGAVGAAALVGLAGVGLATVINGASVVEASDAFMAQPQEVRRVPDHASCLPSDWPVAHRLYLIVQTGELSSGQSRRLCPSTFDRIGGNRQLPLSMDCSVEFAFASSTEDDRPDWVLEHNHSAVMAGDAAIDGLAQVSALSCVQTLQAQEMERLRVELKACMAGRMAQNEGEVTARLFISRQNYLTRYCSELKRPTPRTRQHASQNDPVF